MNKEARPPTEVCMFDLGSDWCEALSWLCDVLPDDQPAGSIWGSCIEMVAKAWGESLGNITRLRVLNDVRAKNSLRWPKRNQWKGMPLPTMTPPKQQWKIIPVGAGRMHVMAVRNHPVWVETRLVVWQDVAWLMMG
ncbi:hypothetical protein ASPWEDRAFT_28098 [Aspergillus wentii DTO 134E9]|uniref:Uncharacterized protein n=1 Tax=Aspergillus wentii DTO 134E9 TaxID=1073089 RepID=A0A1L9RKK5_ASPWE|nr:uncharacterized protein ASPWEDRAFT_28098 [Aspergillus wentii DTO 134E9]OJJ35466.1 hypothetical protein ASPWEDRAFT_28098 [Aspergillus wentii DTO 134E9]